MAHSDQRDDRLRPVPGRDRSGPAGTRTTPDALRVPTRPVLRDGGSGSGAAGVGSGSAGGGLGGGGAGVGGSGGGTGPGGGSVGGGGEGSPDGSGGAPGSVRDGAGRLGAGQRRGAGQRLGAAAAALLDHDLLVLGALLLLAAAIRLVGLPTRGDFDGDQGHDLLTLLRFVRDGQVPLLGPPTSVGDFHHGAMYYFVLAPVAWLFGPDPIAILGAIAGLGVAAVGVAWWLARAIGGRTAAAIAGLLLAVSPAAVTQSTFIWNPNLIPFFAVTAMAAAWRGHQTGRARWWALAVACAGLVAQLHVLGVVLMPPVLALAATEWRTARRAADPARRTGAIGAGVAIGLVLVAAMFVPLAVHELESGFSETRRAIAYFTAPEASATTATTLDPVVRLAFTTLRVIGWPLVGLVTSAPLASIVGVSIAIVLGVWRMVVARGEEGLAARWLGLTIAWGIVALTILAPSLQTVVAGLPNDHYHAFLDPAVVILVALGLRAMGRADDDPRRADRAARALVLGLLAIAVAFDVTRWPPIRQPDGGWPAAQAAGQRIVADVPGATFDVRAMPVFKTAEGIGFPVVAAGGRAVIATDASAALAPATPGDVLVIVCDRLFTAVMVGPCGGPAEDWLAAHVPGFVPAGGTPALVDRFDASPRTAISVYRP